MNDEDGEPLSGDVEVDETSWGGKPRKGQARRSDRAVDGCGVAHREAKPTILGMVERGGRLRFRVIPSRTERAG